MGDRFDEQAREIAAGWGLEPEDDALLAADIAAALRATPPPLTDATIAEEARALWVELRALAEDGYRREPSADARAKLTAWARRLTASAAAEAQQSDTDRDEAEAATLGLTLREHSLNCAVRRTIDRLGCRVANLHDGPGIVTPEDHAELIRVTAAIAALRAIKSVVQQERRAQIAKWGGADHDDTHEPADWIGYIAKHARLCGEALMHPTTPGFGPMSAEARGVYRKQLVRVAALCVAAVESLDRRVAAHAIRALAKEPSR